MSRTKNRRARRQEQGERSRASAPATRATARLQRVQRIYAATVWAITLGLVVFLIVGLLRIYLRTPNVQIPCVLFPVAGLAIMESIRVRCYWSGRQN